MSNLHESYRQKLTVTQDLVVDPALRTYLLSVFNKAALGLILAASLAYVTSSVPVARDLLFRTVTTAGAPRLAGLTSLGSLVTIAPILLLMFAGGALSKPSPLRTGALYWSVVALIGASMGLLVLAFTGASIATTFVVSAAAFGGLSLTGYLTKKDLSGLGGFLATGVIGLIATLAVNLFLHSAAIFYVANMAGVLIFAGLIAHNTQGLKLAFHQIGDDRAAVSAASNVGALALFISFINLFQFLLLMMSGDRR